MNDFIRLALDALCRVGTGVVFVFLLSALAVLFALGIILTKRLGGYSRLKRIWYPFTVLACSAIQLSVSLRAGEDAALAALIIGMGSIFCAVLFSLNERDGVGKKQKEFIEYIDGKIAEEENENKNENLSFGGDTAPENDFPIPEIKEKKRSPADFQLDFAHVRNVISRLSYYGLTQNDKRQVAELEFALSEAEKGEFTPEIKSRINDGLGALLKILSKYGV